MRTAALTAVVLAAGARASRADDNPYCGMDQSVSGGVEAFRLRDYGLDLIKIRQRSAPAILLGLDNGVSSCPLQRPKTVDRGDAGSK